MKTVALLKVLKMGGTHLIDELYFLNVLLTNFETLYVFHIVAVSMVTVVI